MFLFKFLNKILWLCILVWFIGLMYFISLVPREQIDKGDVITDAAIVLTGGNNRIEEGFNILRQKKSKILFITGVDKAVSKKQIMALYGNLPNLDQNKVEIGKEAKSTNGNAIEAKAWVEKNHIKSITLVTANYHMPRSLLEFRRAMPDTKIIIHPVFPEKFKLMELWENPGSVILLVKEYNRTLSILYEQKIIN